MHRATVASRQLEQAPGSLVITDTDGHILYANAAVERRTGYGRKEFMGKNPSTLWGGGMEQQYYSDLWDEIVHQRPFVDSLQNTHKDGSVIDQYIHIAPIVGANSKTEYYIEMQLSPEGRVSEKQFQSNFTTLFAQYQDDPVTIFEWMIETLSGDAINVRPGTNLAQLLFDLLIVPNGFEYSNRMVDAEYIRRAQSNSSDYGLLYTKYKEDIEWYFSKRVDSIEEAHDLMQETFFKAFRSVGTFRTAEASYKTYLMRIAHNVLVNYYRDNKQVIELHENMLQYLDERDPFMAMHVDAALHGLSSAEEQAVRLKYWQGYRIWEIAQMLDRSENAVKLLLSRARKKLRTTIQQ